MPLVPRNRRQARLFGNHVVSRHEESVNRNGLLQAVFDQGKSLRPIVTPSVAPLVLVISIDWSGDERTREESVQVNRINIGKNDSGLPLQQPGEIFLSGKLRRGARWTTKMKRIPRLRSAKASCVMAGTRRITEAGRSK